MVLTSVVYGLNMSLLAYGGGGRNYCCFMLWLYDVLSSSLSYLPVLVIQIGAIYQ